MVQEKAGPPAAKKGAGRGRGRGMLQIQDREQDREQDQEQDRYQDQDREHNQDRFWTNPKITLLICTYEEFQSGFRFKTHRSVWLQVIVFIKYYCFLLSIY